MSTKYKSINRIAGVIVLLFAGSSCQHTQISHLTSVQGYNKHREAVEEAKVIVEEEGCAPDPQTCLLAKKDVVTPYDVNITDAEILAFATALSKHFLEASERKRVSGEYVKFAEVGIKGGIQGLTQSSIFERSLEKISVLNLIDVAQLNTVFNYENEAKNFRKAAQYINKCCNAYYMKKVVNKGGVPEGLSDCGVVLLEGCNATISLLDSSATQTIPDESAMEKLLEASTCPKDK